MARIIFLQITLYLVSFNVLCLHASGYASEKCSQTNSECGENGSKKTQATEAKSNDCHSIPEIEEALNNLRSKLAGFPEAQKKLDEVRVPVKEQKEENKDSCQGKSDKIALGDVMKLLTTTKNSIEKIKSKDSKKILEGVLAIISSFANLVVFDKRKRDIIQTIWQVAGWLFMESKSDQSVVDQLTNVVHDEMMNLNRRLQDQKYNGLKRRVKEQIFQLQRMKEGEKLDDPNLWNDYAQFLGELAQRFESPLPFKYENNLTGDVEVKDFITAVVTYSEAHSCFMALLFVAKAKYTELGIAHEDDVATVERKMNYQSKDAKEKLSFLSEKRFLTFRGKIEDGKLLKILALSRRIRDRRVVETVRHSLGLSPMPDLSTVESSAKKVNQQAVTLRSVQNCNWFLYQYSGIYSSIQFINDVDFPIKIESGGIGWSQGNQLQFVELVPPRERFHKNTHFSFSTAGHITLCFNSILSCDVGASRENIRVFEFAMSFVFYDSKISMQDKTAAEFSRGLDAYNERSEDAVTLYFSEDGKYYIVKAEIFLCWPDRIWRFIIQDFDPEAVGD